MPTNPRMMKMGQKTLIGIAVCALMFAPNAHAQSFQNSTNLIAVQQRMMDVAPDMGEGEGSEVTGYNGSVHGNMNPNGEALPAAPDVVAQDGTTPTAPAVPAQPVKVGGMSPSEITAFLKGPRNWFSAVGKGGSPYTKPISLDSFAKVLSPQDEDLYRKAFASIGQGKLEEISALTVQLKDNVLLGHVEAAALLRPDAQTVTQDALHAWLNKYADLPEADEIYERAKKLFPQAAALFKKPITNQRFSGSVERADGGGTIEWRAGDILTVAGRGKVGATFAKLLRNGKSHDALNYLEDNAFPENQAIAAKLAVAEVLMRAGNAAKAWPLIRDCDVTKAGLDGDALNYALWLKGIVAWTQQAYAPSFDAFKQLAGRSLAPPNKAAAAFWAARAAEKNNLEADSKIYLSTAASYPRTFYGLLAMNRSKTTPHYNWNLPAFSKITADAFKKNASGKRALALLQLGERSLAEAELREIQLHGNPVLQNGLLALASRYAFPSLSVEVGSAFGGKYDAALYPLIPWQPSNGYVADPALVLAIAKNESHFIHTAISPAGASGLMQIMPQTAEMMREGSSKNLDDPQLNVTLGDKYLEMLTRTDGIDNNLLFIIGSYNAGPRRILGLYNTGKQQNGEDPLLFIETLPIKETRDYMQKVMTTYWVYRARFNKPLTAMAELTVGRWPTYSRGNVKLTMTEK